MDSAVSDLVVIIKQQAGFVSARPQWDCLLEVCKEIVKKNPKTSNELKETRAGIFQKLVLSAALAQKGRVPLGLLWTCTSSIPIWYYAGLIKLQHNQQLVGLDGTKLLQAAVKPSLPCWSSDLHLKPALSATVQHLAQKCCPSHPAVGHSPGAEGARDALEGTRRVTGNGSHELIHFLYPKRHHKLQQLFQICFSPVLPPAHSQNRS